MFRPLITGLSIVIAAVTLSPAPAYADPTQDQQYLELVRSNGVAGQDQTLLAYARQVCAARPGEVDFNLVPELINQIGWFNTSGIYVIQTAAARVCCPNEVIQPPAPAYLPPPFVLDTN